MNKKYNIIIYILLIIPFIKLPGYIIGNTLDTVYDICKIISCAFIFVIYIYKYRKISKMLIAIMLFQISFIVSTTINGSLKNVFDQLIQGISVISICMLTEIGIKEDCKQYFKAMCIVLTILTIANSYTMIKYYLKGMYVDELNHWEYYFLGYDNSSFFIEFPLLIYSACYSYIKYNKVKPFIWIMTGIIVFSYFYVKSATSLIMTIIFTVYLLTYRCKIWIKILDFRVVIAMVIIIFLLVVIFNIQNYLSDFLEGTLQKEATLTGRDYIWKQAKSYIVKSPIIGYGMEDFGTLMSKFGINHVHDIFLDIMYNGGIIALSFYCAILNICKKQINANRNSFILNTISIGLFIYLFSGIFDYYNNKYIIFTFFILAAYGNKIAKLVENKEQKEMEKTNAKN